MAGRGVRPVDPEAIRPTLALDEIERMAGYGPRPEGLLEAVVYALAVLRRRSALREARIGARRRYRVAAQDAERALCAFGRRVVEAKEDVDPPLRQAIEAATRALAEAQAAAERGSTVLASVARDGARAEAEIAAANAEVGPIRDQETKLLAQLEVAEHDLKRVRARLSRAEIELRHLRGTESGSPEKVTMLEAEMEARRAEAGVLEGRVAARTQELGRVRRALSLCVGRVAAAEEARARAGQQSKAAADAEAAAQRVLDDRRDAALVAVGREALCRDLGRALEGFDAAEAAEREWASRGREAALYDAAIDGWDRGGLLKGAGALCAGIALVVVTAVVLFVSG
jgi:hypothetical protein